MQFRTVYKGPKPEFELSYQQQFLLLGSCFADHIGAKFHSYKFRAVSNPFGVLFHPLAIEKVLSFALESTNSKTDDIWVQYQQLWHCWYAHSSFSEQSLEKVKTNWELALQNTQAQLKKTDCVFITLGTAWVYRHMESNKVVSNCHKIPQKAFQKELLSVAEIVNSLNHIIDLIHQHQPKAKVVFTVSPVRHLKDGFVENQRSKAHLLSAVHQMVEENDHCSYFGAYEIMLDELRDYRFYKEDMVHPNKTAVDFIWNYFSSQYMSPNTLKIMEQVEAIQKSLQHKPFNPESEAHLKFKNKLEFKIAQLESQFDFMKF